MNRITRLLHKARFLSRQRRILAYSRKYIITADDIAKPQETAQQTSEAEKSELWTESMIEDLLGDFDTDKSKTDRRIFYEITGRQLIKDEFDDLETSDEEWADSQARAFSLLNYEEDENENRVSLIGNANPAGGGPGGDGKSPTTIN